MLMIVELQQDKIIKGVKDQNQTILEKDNEFGLVCLLVRTVKGLEKN